MTKQNDTQDEAERLAEPFVKELLECLTGADMIPIVLRVYRAGVASREAEIASLKHDLATKSSTDLISEKYRLREQLADSRDEVERLKASESWLVQQRDDAQSNKDGWQNKCTDLNKQLAAEKARSQKLVEALSFYADKETYGSDDTSRSSGNKCYDIICFDFDRNFEPGKDFAGSIARHALRDYSTDSGDGSSSG